MRKMGKIDRSMEIELGGETRRLKYSIAALEELEARTKKSALSLALEAPLALTVTEMIDIAHIGLKHQDRKLSRDTVAGWVGNFLRENPAYTLNVLLCAALGYSGLCGDVSVFEEMADRLRKGADEDAGKSRPSGTGSA
jgi:hypothetical protein